jgi:hypothetical protein
MSERDDERAERNGENALLGLFLRDLRKYPVLSREEEAALVKASAAGDVAARDRLVESNLRFVVRVAVSSYRAAAHSCPGLQLMDLVSEGAIGLMRTLARIDPASGHRVLTYCSYGIRGGIWRYLFEYRRSICLSLDDPILADEEESGETLLDRLPSEDDGADVAALYAQREGAPGHRGEILQGQGARRNRGYPGRLQGENRADREARAPAAQVGAHVSRESV